MSSPASTPGRRFRALNYITLSRMSHFPDVTLLITHYRRVESLQNLLSAFIRQQISFGQIIVSDDCSGPEYISRLQALQQQYHFQLLTAPINKGLANNINKGQDAVKTPYTLYVQEDFVPATGYDAQLQHAVNFMKEDARLDMVRFYAYFNYPATKPYKGGYREMVFSPLSLNDRKFHMYSDHPHLRRSSFLQKFGRYREGIPSDKAEFMMTLSFLKNGGKAVIYHNIKALFVQANTEAEPSTINRKNLTFTSNIFISVPRFIYRIVKHSAQLAFFK